MIERRIASTNRIPYIELSPIEEGANAYIFTMRSYGGISFIDDDSIFNETVYRDNKVDLIATFEKDMGREVLKAKLEESRKSWEAAATKTTEQELERYVKSKVAEMTAKDAISLAQAVLVVSCGYHSDDQRRYCCP